MKTIDEIRQRVTQHKERLEKMEALGKPTREIFYPDSVMNDEAYQIAVSLLAENDKQAKQLEVLRELANDQTSPVARNMLLLMKNAELEVEILNLEGALHVVSGARDVLMAENNNLREEIDRLGLANYELRNMHIEENEQ